MDTYTNLFTIQCHYYGRFDDAQKKEYIEGENCFVDMINKEDFKDDILNYVMQSLGSEMDDEVLFYYKVPLKSLDIGLKPLVSESDYKSFLGYVQKHKVMHVYVKLVEKDKEYDSDSESENEEDTSLGKDPIVPNVNVIEDNFKVLGFDSLESDLEDVSQNARSLGLIKLKKKHSSSKFFIVSSKNVINDKVQGPVVDISGKGKLVNEYAEEDKRRCPWLLYLSKGDKGKYVIKTFKDDHKCLQSRKIKYRTLSFLSTHIIDLIILNPQMPIKAIQEQRQKKFHAAIFKDKAFRAKAKAQVYLRGDVKVQYALLRDYVCELNRGFRECGRELLGLDSAFMRGQYPGQMLTAVGVDANNGIHLGLLPALAKLFPSAEHRAHYDMLINNVCEVFNRQLLDVRDSPIITAQEFMREYLIKMIVIVQKVIQKCDGPLTHAVAKLFDKIKAASTCVLRNGMVLSYTRLKEISDILCKHAIAAIHDMIDNGFDVGIPEDWVHDSYKLQTLMNVYSQKVNPVNGRDMWSKFDCPTTLLPPKVHP
nr:hypothetical protein [Tanacetum cinerariifolium]